MKKCIFCYKSKALGEFHKQGKYRCSGCKVCNNARRHQKTSLDRGAVPCKCCHKDELIQFYVNTPEGMTVDHIIAVSNGGRHCLDNLTYASKESNSRKGYYKEDQTSSYKGVSWKTANKQWCAQITLNRKKKHLGLFKEQKDAATAYAIALLRHKLEVAYAN